MIKFFFSLSLFRLRNVCLITISINKLFEPTYQMYEPLMSIQTMLPKCYVETPVCLEIKHFSFFFKRICSLSSFQ